jgi:hypothetical protein
VVTKTSAAPVSVSSTLTEVPGTATGQLGSLSADCGGGEVSWEEDEDAPPHAAASARTKEAIVGLVMGSSSVEMQQVGVSVAAPE